MKSKLSKYIRNELFNRKMSVEELAKKSGISVDYINKIKRDDYQSVTLDTLQSLAEGFDVPFKQFQIEIGLIDILDDYTLGIKDSNTLINAISIYVEACQIDINELNTSESLELANYVFKTLKMISYKYRK